MIPPSKTRPPHSRKQGKPNKTFLKRLAVAAVSHRRKPSTVRTRSLQSEFHPSAAGRTQVKVAPSPSFADAERRPPCASMIERLMRSPIPMRLGLVE